MLAPIVFAPGIVINRALCEGYRRSLRQEAKRRAVARADRSKVPAIERHHEIGLEPLRECDDRRVSPSERKVTILLDELRHPHPVVGFRSLHVECRNLAKEPGFCRCAKPKADQIRHLGDDESREDQAKVSSLEHRERIAMPSVVLVDCGVERARVNDCDQRSTPARGSPRCARPCRDAHCAREPHTAADGERLRSCRHDPRALGEQPRKRKPGVASPLARPQSRDHPGG